MAKPNVGLLRINFSILEELLRLPPDHHITGMWEDGEYVNTIYLKVAGPTLPETEEGEAYRVVHLETTREEPHGRFV